MTTSIRQLARQRAPATLVGRDREMALLLAALRPGRSAVIHLHGVPGIGKTTLLTAFSGRAAAEGARVIGLDCRAVEPTDRALLAALARAVGARVTTVAQINARLARLGGRTVLVLDHYEHFRLLDTWIRQTLVPTLPDTVLVVMGSREPPVAGWLTAPDLAGVTQVMPLGPLGHGDAVDLLVRLGVPAAEAEGLDRVLRGHPLAIRLAASTAIRRPGRGIDGLAAPSVFEDLTRLYLADVPGPVTRQLLEAASVVRRVTASLLSAMLPGVAAPDALERIATLPFVELGSDGLIVHEAVRSTVGRSLHATDPVRFRQYKRRAWHALREEVRDAAPDELWRYTADMLYLIENPVVREAFFPSGAQPLAVEPATELDRSSIELISSRHDGEAGRDLMRAWWRHDPASFSVVRDRDGAVTGFLCLLDHRAMGSRQVAEDPVVAGWRRHLRAEPVPSGQLVLGLRRWLDVEHGELPCASQAAAWLDVKRTYMELRPRLRRIYTVVEDPSVYLPVVSRLGFRPVGAADGVAEVGGRNYTSVMLDFGPASVDGWLAGLVAAELGLAPDAVVDNEAREVRVGGDRLQLTPLEFGLFTCLQSHEGRAVSRATLLETVWGYRSDNGSNVVDVTVRRLRDKLGGAAATIETIRGSGYRLRLS